jgi:integrase
MHDLRHFYASGLIASGCDVATDQRALRAASAITTLVTERRSLHGRRRRTRTAAEHLMASAVHDRGDLVRTRDDP